LLSFHILPEPLDGRTTLCITQAQQSPERAWPADASSVVLQQSARDLDQVFRNGWAGLKGKRKGPKVRAPRFKQRRGAPSIRFLSHVFRTGERSLRLSKVGPVPIEWSRSLRSEASSVMVIRDASGRYFASFVVEVEPTPLIAHGKALGLEDLNVSGMVKNNKLAGSIADAGWRQFRSLLQSRAEQYGRELVVVRLPTNQVCSACGHHDGSKELSIREWQCPSCGTVHDREINAASNILVAGLAERRNGRGAAHPSTLAVAAGCEAPTQLNLEAQQCAAWEKEAPAFTPGRKSTARSRGTGLLACRPELRSGTEGHAGPWASSGAGLPVPIHKP